MASLPRARANSLRLKRRSVKLQIRFSLGQKDSVSDASGQKLYAPIGLPSIGFKAERQLAVSLRDV